MNHMLDIDTDIKSFQKELKRAKKQLLDLIPLELENTISEENKVCKQNHYDLFYLRDRQQIYIDNLSYQDWIISDFIKEKQMLKFRKEQYELLKDELKHTCEMFNQTMSLLENAIEKSDQTSPVEYLLKNTSLANPEVEEVDNLCFPKGYIYLIKEHHTCTYKIGRTSNPKNRLSLFNVKLPFKWECISLHKSNHVVELESDLHKLFSNKRKDGEWFGLNEDDLLLYFEVMSEYTVSESIENYRELDIVVKEVEQEYPNEIDEKHIFASSVHQINELVKNKRKRP